MTTLTEKQVKKRAKKNIENFLKELDAQIPEDSEEIYSDNYYSNLFQSVWIARMLNEYDKRKEQAKKELSSFLEQIELEGENGFKYLSNKRKREVNEERKYQAEKIVINARLGPDDVSTLLVPVVHEIYRRGGFGILGRYKHHHSQK